MVDWDAVEDRRARGWGWDQIARDPKVDFHPDPPLDRPGAALRQIYYRRQATDAKAPEGSGTPPLAAAPTRPRRWQLGRSGYFLTGFFGIWFLLAYFVASPIGAYFPALPVLGLLVAISVFLLAFALLRIHPRFPAPYRTALVIGVVGGLIVAGGLGAGAALQGCPLLTPFTSAEPGGWVKLPNAAWTDHGRPVLFFYGSVACPYCSASSWAIAAALQKFGNLSGISFGASSSSDVYPNTPSVILANVQLASSWVSFLPLESTNANEITTPSPTACIQQAYVSAYDLNGGIPFIVLGGTYAHASTLVDPGALGGLNATTLLHQMASETGTGWTAASSQAYYLMAFLLKLDGGQPAALSQVPGVAAALAQIG